MAGRFIDKVTTASTANCRNLPDAAGIVYDTVDGVLKYNDNGTLRAVGAIGLSAQITPTAAITLTVAQSGATVLLNAAAGFAITLPAVANAGARFRFQTAAAFATTPFTIVSAGGANIIQGGAIVNSVYVPAVNEDSINFVESAETIGDYVDVQSDGTNWLVDGVGALAGSITFTVT